MTNREAVHLPDPLSLRGNAAQRAGKELEWRRRPGRAPGSRPRKDHRGPGQEARDGDEGPGISLLDPLLADPDRAEHEVQLRPVPGGLAVRGPGQPPDPGIERPAGPPAVVVQLVEH